jgi:hypothetical protein
VLLYLPRKQVPVGAQLRLQGLGALAQLGGSEGSANASASASAAAASAATGTCTCTCSHCHSQWQGTSGLLPVLLLLPHAAIAAAANVQDLQQAGEEGWGSGSGSGSGAGPAARAPSQEGVRHKGREGNALQDAIKVSEEEGAHVHQVGRQAPLCHPL